MTSVLNVGRDSRDLLARLASAQCYGAASRNDCSFNLLDRSAVLTAACYSCLVADPDAAAVVWCMLLQRLEEVMERKNGTIRGLQYDLSKVCKAHNDLIRVYEAKLSDFGIPAEELGFRPLIINTTTGPAGLVVGA